MTPTNARIDGYSAFEKTQQIKLEMAQVDNDYFTEPTEKKPASGNLRRR